MGCSTLDGSDERKLEADLAYAKRRFGMIETVPHRSVAVPGSVETFDFRAQNPAAPTAASCSASFRQVSDRQHEVAVTDGVADLLQLELGSTLALDGRRRTVVGVVENPRKLSDEFALVSPSSAGALIT